MQSNAANSFTGNPNTSIPAGIKAQRYFKSLLVAVSLIAGITLAPGARAQSVYTYNSTSSTVWFTTGNWTGGVAGKYPGVSGMANPGNANDIALFGATVPSSGNIGINMNATAGATLNIGAISVTGATAITLSNSSATANLGTRNVVLNGAPAGNSAGLVAKTLLNATGANLTLNPGSATGTVLGARLGITDGIINADSGRTVAINVGLSESGTNSGFSKTGAGTLTLSASNTYSGTTVVASGRLQVTNNVGSGTGTGSVTVGNDTSVATLGGTGIISGAVTTVSNGSNIAHIAPGLNVSGTLAGTLQLNGGLTLGAGSMLDFDLASTTGGTSDQITLGGSMLTLGNTFTVNYNLLTQGTLQTGSDYTLLSGASNPSIDLNGITINSTGLGGYTPNYNYLGGSLTVSFSSVVRSLLWNPGTNTNWNTTDQNWRDESSNQAAFANNDVVNFNDNGGVVNVDAEGVTAGNIFVNNFSGTYTFQGGSIGGSGKLTKINNGTLLLAGSNSYSGGTEIGGGVLQISDDNQLGATTGALTLAGGTLQTTANVSLSSARGVSGNGTFDITDGTTLTVNGTFAGTTVTLSNSGTLTLAGASNSVSSLSFAAPATLNVTGGALSLSGAVTTGSTSGTVTINGSVNLNGADRSFNVANGSADIDVIVSGSLSSGSGTRRLTKDGTGTLQLSGTTTSATVGVRLNSGTLNVTNKNALGGAQFFANGGTVQATTALTGANALPNSISVGGDITFQGPDITLTGANTSGTNSGFDLTTFGASNGVVRKLTVLNTFRVDGDNGRTSGFVNAGLEKSGTGTLILGGNITYTGTTTVVAGTLRALGSMASSPLDIGAGGTFEGTATLGNTIVSGTFNPGTNGTTGTISLADAMTLTLQGTVNFDIADASTFDLVHTAALATNTSVIFGGTLNLFFSGGSYADQTAIKLFDVSNYSGNFSSVVVAGLTSQMASFDSTTGIVTITNVPEPGTWAALFSGGAVLAMWCRNRRKENQI